ncbi:tyrosine-type recombinase/integrase [Stenotrophomonas sp. WHRI 8082]|uniref:tyrosine-type recombinase/integrase n=1 Tax=Stenotrophomonas sp. WHRI 8082 TaxID=3162571 RepID=UPI0032ECAB9A
MARPINRLSARAVQTLTKQGYHADGGGLYLLVKATGSKSWVLRFRRGGRLREMGLGSTQVVSLQEARAAALEHRKHLAGGEDPIDARRAARSAGATFGQAAEAYIDAHRAGWKSNAQADQWAQSLRDYGPAESLPIAQIDTSLVMACLRPIWSTKTETATRVRGRIERVLDWAKVHGLREGDNPARWRGHLENLLPKPSKVKPKRHHAAMPYVDVPAFMARLPERDAKSRRALRFTILTAARTEEVTGSTWAEFDLDAMLWTVPAARMKGGREHVVPLTLASAAILDGLPRSAPPFALSENAMLYLLQKPAPKGFGLPFTVHGFRSSFRDWAAEQTEFSREVAEMALAHAIRDKTEAAYRRGALIEKRRILMQSWEQYCISSLLEKRR